MNLSVPYSFQPGLIAKLAAYPQVKDMYAKLPRDPVGGGRSSYTLRPAGFDTLVRSVKEAHHHGIEFNYLLNAAGLYGLEQTRIGQKKLRLFIDAIAGAGVDSVTVSLPYLLRIIKREHPELRVKVGVFALVDSPAKARQWEQMGADVLCISAIACNRDFDQLARIRSSVRCELVLIANASCMPQCAWEPTHMHLLTQSSRSGDRLGGFCFDYCFLQCSSARLREPVSYVRSVWIRPEDLGFYRELGYETFKLVERSCPEEMLLRRVAAYATGSFDGNLWELVAPIASIAKEQNAPFLQRLKMFVTFLRPDFMKLSSVFRFKRYAETVIPREFDRTSAPVYIDNRALDGFLEDVLRNNCRTGACDWCGVCQRWAAKAVSVNEEYARNAGSMAASLESDLVSGSLW
jgi:collagenase-like PrtC family protease